MAPHKDPARLPITDQLKLIREELEDQGLNISNIKYSQRSQAEQTKLERIDIKGLSKRFDQQDKKFDKLYKLIDGFTGRIKSQDIEIAAASTRSEDHETRISKMEGKSYNPATT